MHLRGVQLSTLFHTLRLKLKVPPAWARQGVGIAARISGVVVIAVLLVLAYQQRHVLLSAIHLKPLYLIPTALFYAVGFGLAVASWHLLLRTFGEQHRLLDNYVMYAVMSAYRNFPIPYLYLATLIYGYKKRGTAYKTTGLVFVAFSLLYAVAGALLFSLVALSGVSMGHSWITYGAVVASLLAAFALHPTIFRQLIVAASRGPDTVLQDAIPTITWKPVLLFVLLNALILLSGGGLIFFCAKIVLDIPLALLPVCIAAWSLAVCVACLLFWLPSDFGLTNLALLAVFQSSLSISHFVAMFAVFRLITVVLDLFNVSIAFLVQRWQQTTRTQGQTLAKEINVRNVRKE